MGGVNVGQDEREVPTDNCKLVKRTLVESTRRGLLCDCRMAEEVKLQEIHFPQPADFSGLASRDLLGVYHAISRLLGQFETFRACWAGGESRDFVAATTTEPRGDARCQKKTMPRFPRGREEKVERRPQERGERRSEFSSALLSPFSSLLLYCRGAAMEAAGFPACRRKYW